MEDVSARSRRPTGTPRVMLSFLQKAIAEIKAVEGTTKAHCGSVPMPVGTQDEDPGPT